MTIAAKKAHVAREARKPHRAHRCHAEGCERDVPPVYFMCPRHWRMVPREMQARIWATYNSGQENGDADVTEAYLEAHREATEAVARAEGRR